VLDNTNPGMMDTMKNLSEAEADAFARDWAAAWNSHDVDRIVDHYRHDIQYYSPFAAPLGASTPLSGRSGLRRYVAAALERYPSVQFGPDLVAAAGAGSIAIGYRSVGNLLAIETLAIDDHGLITLARCHYRQAPPGWAGLTSAPLCPPERHRGPGRPTPATRPPWSPAHNKNCARRLD
jgi:hypothetical protein